MSTKTIVITGGNSGIGLACAKYLVQQEYQVIITGRNPQTLQTALSELGPNAEGYVSDTSDLKQIDALVAQLTNQQQQIDGLFINAGIFQPASFEGTTEALFDQTMQINFKGAFFTIQKFLPLLKSPSAIVLNSSIAVFKAFANASIYTASKAALESIAQVLNLELAPKGIRVNVISPGVTHTPIQKRAGMTEEQIGQMVKDITATSPIGRVLVPEDIAPILEFLVSDRSQVLRNEKIVVDGGTTL